jgi:hypothetical protein
VSHISVLASFPAKIIDFGVFGIAYTVTLTDSFKGADYLRKAPVKSVVDSSKGVDFLGVATVFHIAVADVSEVADRISRECGKRLADSLEGVDAISSVASFHAIVHDAVLFTDYIVKSVSKVFEFEAPSTGWVKLAPAREVRDSFRGLDWIFRYLVKGFKDYVIVRDAPSRLISIILMDAFKDEGRVAKAPSIGVSDVAVMSDILIKIAFKLMGYDVRRVYFHKVWGDIIESQDHNLKILICKALLEAFKRVRDKLG